MQKHKISIGLTVLAAILFLWSINRNMAQELEPTAIRTADDIAAAGGAVFVLEGKTLTKLNAQLDVVKSVPLPLSPTPTPPSPIPDISDGSAMQETPLVDPSQTGRLGADAQRVYVLFEETVYAFDHDLNYLFSKSRDYTE